MVDANREATLGERTTAQLPWAVCGLLLAVLALREIPLSDLTTHLKLGGRMVSEGTPYLREIYAVGHIGEALSPIGWLAQALYHLVYAALGWPALRAFDALVWFAGFATGLFPLREKRAVGMVAALAIGFAIALPAAGIRPQSFAALGFGLTLLLLRHPSRKAMLWSVPLFVFWQNLHPSVTVAVAVIGAVALPPWVAFLRKRGPIPSKLTMMGITAVLAIFATPAGADFLVTAGSNAQASHLAGATEWFPLWSPVNQAFLFPVIISALFVALLGRKARWADFASCIVCFFLTLLAVRFVVFYAIALVPLLANSIAMGPRPARPVPALATAGLLGVAALMLAPVRFSPSPEGPAALRGSFGTFYTDPNLGGLVEGPTRRVTLDGRFYLYSDEELREIWRTQSDPATLHAIEAQFRPAGFALTHFRSAALIDALERRPQQWRKVWEDEYSVYFVRTSAGDPIED
jgi:hypothetical protein